jgi:hypothetical protein
VRYPRIDACRNCLNPSIVPNRSSMDPRSSSIGLSKYFDDRPGWNRNKLVGRAETSWAPVDQVFVPSGYPY